MAVRTRTTASTVQAIAMPPATILSCFVVRFNRSPPTRRDHGCAILPRAPCPNKSLACPFSYLPHCFVNCGPIRKASNTGLSAHFCIPRE